MATQRNYLNAEQVLDLIFDENSAQYSSAVESDDSQIQIQNCLLMPYNHYKLHQQ